MQKALIVIDVQQYLLNQHTKLIPRKIAKFLEKNKDFDFILFFKFINDKNSNWVKILKWERMIAPEETEIAPELKRFLSKQNVFIKKAAFSVFRSKKFIKFIKVNNINKLYICGLDTNACVFTSVMEAFERGFEVKVIEDLCATHQGERYHKSAIESLKRNLGKSVVISSIDF